MRSSSTATTTTTTTTMMMLRNCMPIPVLEWYTAPCKRLYKAYRLNRVKGHYLSPRNGPPTLPPKGLGTNKTVQPI